MNKCSACGADVNENAEKCEYCGSPLTSNNNVNFNNHQPKMTNNTEYNKEEKNTQHIVEDFTKEDMEENKVMAVLGYVFPIVPYLVEKNSKWVRFHSIQGMNLWIYGIILTVVLTIITVIFSIIPFIGVIISALIGLLLFAVSIGSFALGVIGIVNVLKMQAKPLPIIDKIKILKK